MAIERRFIAFYGLAVSAVVTLLNEAVLKPIVKDPRPKGSANRKSFGQRDGQAEPSLTNLSI